MKKILSLLLILTLSLTGTSAFAAEETAPSADTDITLDGKTLSVTGDGVELDESDIVIRDAGVYRLSGSFDGFRFVIKAEDKSVTLLLDNVTVTNETDEAIYAKEAAALTVYVLPGTENTLTGGLASDLEANKQTDNSGAALRAKCPLTVCGSGRLTVNGYINNGIAAEGDLVLSGVTLAVTCANDAIKSDAALTVHDGTYIVTSGHDAFYAGTVLTVEDGSFTVFTGVGSSDADMKVSDSLMMGNMGGGSPGGNRNHGSSGEASGETENTASGEASGETSGEPTDTETAASGEPVFGENAPVEATDADGAASGEADEESASNRHSRASGEMPGGGMMMPGMPGAGGEASGETETVSDSAKGLKAAVAVKISGGKLLLDCEDDAIHSDGSVSISGGDITIYAGDDGIHGTDLLSITGGSVFVNRCYEGLEGAVILIDDGVVNITATDDGFNASTGRTGGFGGFGGFGGSGEAGEEPEDLSATPVGELEGPLVRIRGGVVTVDSGGDGLDSNGSMYIYGGTVRVSGPSSDWDAAIDTGEGGSTFLIAGGDVMAAGYSSMAETPESAEASQCSIYCKLDEATVDGTLCTLADSDGNILQEYTFVHGYNCVIFSSPKLVIGETYTITAGDNEKTIELTDTVYSERGGFGMGGGRGGR